MATVRGKKPELHNKTADKRITICSDCRFGIFPQHAYIWTRRGLVHQECEDKKVANEAKAVEKALSEQ